MQVKRLKPSGSPARICEATGDRIAPLLGLLGHPVFLGRTSEERPDRSRQRACDSMLRLPQRVRRGVGGHAPAGPLEKRQGREGRWITEGDVRAHGVRDATKRAARGHDHGEHRHSSAGKLPRNIRLYTSPVDPWPSRGDFPCREVLQDGEGRANLRSCLKMSKAAQIAQLRMDRDSGVRRALLHPLLSRSAAMFTSSGPCPSPARSFESAPAAAQPDLDLSGTVQEQRRLGYIRESGSVPSKGLLPITHSIRLCSSALPGFAH